MYCAVITTNGLKLLASLGAGEQLTITRCMVGSGAVGDVAAAMALTDLVKPEAAATSTKPYQKGNECSLILEYRNDMNGGQERELDITEFGVWAQVGSAAEKLLLYGCLSDRPKRIGAYEGSALEIQRFPVTFAISNDCPVVLGCNALAFMTAEDVSVYCTEVILPIFLEDVDRKIAAHSNDPESHPDIRVLIDSLSGKVNVLQLQLTTNVTGNPWEVTFNTLDGLIVTGVWNKAQARLEC